MFKLDFITAFALVLQGYSINRNAWKLSVDHMSLFTDGVGNKSIIQMFKSGSIQTARLTSGDLLAVDYFVVQNPMIATQSITNLPTFALGRTAIDND